MGDTLCRVADSLAGPWRPPSRELLLPQWNVVFRFCEWHGRTLLYHWLRSKADWQRRGYAGATYMAVTPPKEIAWDHEGNPTLKPFAGWSAYHRGRARTVAGAAVVAVGQRLVVRTVNADHFIAPFNLTLDSGRAAGLVFRSDKENELANYLRLDFDRQMIELHKWDVWDSGLRRYKRVQPTLVQSLPARLRRGQPVRVRLLACAEYIEVSLDDIVHLSAATYRRQRGGFAFAVEDGSARFSPMSVQPIRVPAQPD